MEKNHCHCSNYCDNSCCGNRRGCLAQNLNSPTQTPLMNGYGQIPTIGNPNFGNNVVMGGFMCPRLYSPKIETQNGYSIHPRIGMGGMMQRAGW